MVGRIVRNSPNSALVKNYFLLLKTSGDVFLRNLFSYWLVFSAAACGVEGAPLSPMATSEYLERIKGMVPRDEYLF